MIALVIRTDKPEAEIGLFDNRQQIAYKKWLADRRLTKTIHHQLQLMLDKSSISLDDLGGIVCFKGPGSFTGLRIGLGLANALAYAKGIPVVATAGKNWIADGIKKLAVGSNDVIALPGYGHPVNITLPKK